MHLIADQDLPLLGFLTRLSPNSSKNTLRSWLEKGRVTVNGEVAKRASHLVKSGEEVKVGPRTTFIEKGIRILYEDRDLIVIDKPEGILSVATDFEHEKSAHAILKHRFHAQKIFPVHRLDRETSGVMVFAYTEKARKELKEQFVLHSIEREYIALVEGKLKEKKGTWQSYLLEDSRYFVASVPPERGGDLAITHYEVLRSMDRFTVLKLKLETGRKNQIRVHCKEATHPVVGDEKYGSTFNPYHRLCLHAIRLGFVHPTSSKKILFESSPPPFFRLVE